MRVLVCGGRKFNGAVLEAELSRIHKDQGIDLLIEGGAPGADTKARVWAQFRDIAVLTYRPDWATYGHAAGPIRNKQMLNEGKPDIVVAFPGGKGTADMVRRAKAAGVRVIEVT